MERGQGRLSAERGVGIARSADVLQVQRHARRRGRVLGHRRRKVAGVTDIALMIHRRSIQDTIVAVRGAVGARVTVGRDAIEAGHRNVLTVIGIEAAVGALLRAGIVTGTVVGAVVEVRVAGGVAVRLVGIVAALMTIGNGAKVVEDEGIAVAQAKVGTGTGVGAETVDEAGVEAKIEGGVEVGTEHVPGVLVGAEARAEVAAGVAIVVVTDGGIRLVDTRVLGRRRRRAHHRDHPDDVDAPVFDRCQDPAKARDPLHRFLVDRTNRAGRQKRKVRNERDPVRLRGHRMKLMERRLLRQQTGRIAHVQIAMRMRQTKKVLLRKMLPRKMLPKKMLPRKMLPRMRSATLSVKKK